MRNIMRFRTSVLVVISSLLLFRANDAVAFLVEPTTRSAKTIRARLWGIYPDKSHRSHPKTAVRISGQEDTEEKPSQDILATSLWRHQARAAVASSIMGLTLFLAPFNGVDSATRPFTPAFARDVTSSASSVLLEPAAPTQAAAVSTPGGTTAITVPDDDLKTVNPANKPSLFKQQQPTTLVDEVWTLVNKYYIDRSFNNQDWNAVRTKYLKLQEQSNNDPDASFRLAVDMVKSLNDKYSRMLDTKQYAAIQKFDLIGVGVTLMPNEQKEIIVGAPPVAGSASAKAGLSVGDQVLAVNGVPTEGRTAFDIIDQISEIPNAKTVTMTVKSDDESTRDITMERAFTEVNNPIRYKVSETRQDGTKVGFIRILEFNSLVKARLEEALKDLQQQGVTALVLDLRGNPGGAFQSAVEISSLFFDNRVATYVVDSNAVELPFKTGSKQVAVDPKIPIAIWLDGRSASASEVLAGSLHDNCRAIVMGEKSFGKGLIQAVYGLKNGSGLVLTVAKYVTPNGTEIQGAGIQPDIQDGVPLFLPGLSTDSSKVDFTDISRRLDPSMCALPSSR